MLLTRLPVFNLGMQESADYIIVMLQPALGRAAIATLLVAQLKDRTGFNHTDWSFCMHRRLPIAILALALSAAASTSFAAGAHAGGHEDSTAAIGEPGKKATRTVTIDMTDNMRFTPASVSVKQGETVKFLVKNSGKIKHELVLGTPEMLKEHYAMMMKMPGMEHAEENMVTVAPGATGEVVWRFSKAGEVQFGCLQPGHFDAGMKGAVTVQAAASRK